jgi:WD40 repeat protein
MAFLAMIMLCMRVEAQTMMTPSVGAETSDQSLDVGYDSVQEILRQHCTSCHNEDQPRADLVLTSLDKILAGSASGPVVVPGDPQASPLYLLAAHLESPKMPPNKPRLSQRELTKLSKWISTGLSAEAKASNTHAPQGTSPLSLAQVRPLSEKNVIRAMAVSPIAPILAIAGNGQVLLWDAQTNTLSDRAIDVGDQEISAIAFSKDGQRLWIAAGTPAESGVLHSWSIPEERYLGSLGNEADTINTLDESQTSKQIAIGTTRRLLKVLSSEGDSEKSFAKHTDWVTSTAYSNDGILVASGDRFGSIIAWDPLAGTEFSTLRGHTGMITSIHWSPNGDSLLSSSLDGSVRVWNMHDASTLKSWQAHDKGVASAGVLASGDLVTLGKNGIVSAWSSPYESDALPTLLWQKSMDDEIITGGVGNHGKTIAVSDATGSVCVGLIDGNSNREDPPSFVKLAIPTYHPQRSFSSIAPREPIRSQTEPTSKLESMATDVPSLSKPLADGTSSVLEPIATPDIDETKRSLESVQRALEQSYETTRQLEETAARLQQMLSIQQARLRQQQLQHREDQHLPKSKNPSSTQP